MFNKNDMLKKACESLLICAKKHGAKQAEAICVHGQSLSVGVREQKLEDLDASEGLDIGLRVIIDKKQACVSGSDLSENALDKLAERCVDMAKIAPTDPYCGLAEQIQSTTKIENLQLYDDTDLGADDLLQRAKILEKTALAHKNIIQAEGSSASQAKYARWLANTNGFSQGYKTSRHSLSVAAFASNGKSMERDYDYKTTRFFEDLPAPETIANKAASRAVARLGAKKIKSGTMPVILHRRVAPQILSSFISAISGRSVARGVSFLKDKMDRQIFAKNINIIDDPFIKRGSGSRPWDGEGIKGKKLEIVKNGVLKSWLLNLASARQLGLETTAHASRPLSSPPGISTSNIWIEAGEKSVQDFISDLENGILVTEMFGPSFNQNTGDYSVGVSGFEIKNGQKQGAVNEITIAANLIEIFKTIQACNDLILDKACTSPSLVIDNMVVSGG